MLVFASALPLNRKRLLLNRNFRGLVAIIGCWLDTVSRYPFEDHNAPPIDLIVECCADIHKWLGEDENHVVGINCKAGKGRTGLIICCYLMHSKVVIDSDEAMLYYGSRRTKDGKGVTIASQQRYVRYYNHVLNIGGTPPEPRLLMLKSVRMHTIPDFAGDPYVIIISQNQEVHRSPPSAVPKKATTHELQVDRPVHGDVKIQFCVKKGRSHQNTCHFWFSTAFIDPETNRLELQKSEIDVANKDKKNAHFKADFRLEAFFEPIEVPKKDKKASRKSDKKQKRGTKPPSPAPTDAAVASSSVAPSSSNASINSAPSDTPPEPASPVAKPNKVKKGVAIAEPEKASTESSSVEAEVSSNTPQAAPAADAPEQPISAATATTAPATADDGFAQRRKRAQSFYDTSSSDEGLSSSELEEKQMDAYFEAEEDEEDDAPAAQDASASPRANGSASPKPIAVPASPATNGHTESAPSSPLPQEKDGKDSKKDKKKDKKEEKKDKKDKTASTPASPEPSKKEKKKEKEEEKEKEKEKKSKDKKK